MHNKFKRSIVIILAFALIAFSIYLFYNINKPDLNVPLKKTFDIIRNINKEINNPPPLKIFDDGIANADLSVSGVFKLTNVMRKENGNLNALVKNEKLNIIAEKRLDDMFQKQYFEHISPTGESVSGIAEKNGYEYILMGENIALGNFDGDKALVQAWMDSPGHRANILNNRYAEIGIAVQKNKYENRETWMAIQVFALPLAACPGIDENLKKQIGSNNEEIVRMENSADNTRIALENSRPRSAEEIDAYNKKIVEYNRLVSDINALVVQTKNLIQKYNSQVDAFNRCAKRN